MKLKRIMFAAPKSGSGKTTITCGILQALKNMGEQVVSFKCGPDYIDPMSHKTVIDIPSKNLDTFFTDPDMTRTLFLKGRSEDDFAVIEGVMGLFDGLGGVCEEGSSYHLAQVTKTPIVLVVDTKGMARSVLPYIAGFLAYDQDHLIKGVVLNRTSKAMYDLLRPLIEEELHVAVTGYFPEQKQFQLGSRHLGLIMPDELSDIKNQMRHLAEEVVKTISIEQICMIANEAQELDNTKKRISCDMKKHRAEEHPVIAVAKDEAFCFYYEDNLQMLKDYGAEIVFFSPVHDNCLPENCDALLIGGGYPELHLDKLSNNENLKAEIKQAFEHGMPMVAECGGFMYLHSYIKDQKNVPKSMVGILPGGCYNKGKLVRFGYIEIEEGGNHFLDRDERIRAHEFHYYDSEENGMDCTAIKPATGKKYPCIHSGCHYWFGFPHLSYPSNPSFAKQFVVKARNYKNRK